MLEGDESHEPTRRDAGHNRWLAMQSAYAEYRGTSEALECARQSANESSINERSLLTIAVDRQRVAFECYFEARMEFLEFRFDESNRLGAGRVAPATRDTDHSSIGSAVRRWLAMSFGRRWVKAVA
jgi:hypothetical protein